MNVNGRSLIRRTPIVPATGLGRDDIFLKMECHQFSGSFKSRGVVSFLQGKEGIRGLVTYTTGNQGIAVAAIAQQLDLPAFVVTSKGISAHKRALIENYGGFVEMLDFVSLEQSVRYATNVAARNGYLYVPLFDDDQILVGYATIADELCEDFPKAFEAYFPMGSGSLLFANAKRLKSINSANTVIGVEPSVYQRWSSCEPKDTYSASLADGLALNMIPSCNRQLIVHTDAIVAISEGEIVNMQQQIAKYLNIHIEPSAAIAVVAAFHSEPSPRPKVAIVTGSNSARLT